MTEKEKRDLGLLYNAGNETMLRERAACKKLCRRLNDLQPEQTRERQALYEKLFGKAPETVWTEPMFWCDYGYNIFFGEYCFFNHGCVILDCAKVTFGDRVFVGPNTGFYTAGHPENLKQRSIGMEYAKPITVGDDVWIGGGVQVLPGVTIGKNSIIGAGSVVTRDIPENVVAAGNPCRVLRPASAGGYPCSRTTEQQ